MLERSNQWLDGIWLDYLENKAAANRGLLSLMKRTKGMQEVSDTRVRHREKSIIKELMNFLSLKWCILLAKET